MSRSAARKRLSRRWETKLPQFKITTADGTYKITADTPELATQALEQYQSNNYSGPTQDDKGTPEGMVLDPNTGAMVDAKAIANKMDMNGAALMAEPARGLPAVGSWLDELFAKGMATDKPYQSEPVMHEVVNQVFKRAEDANPKTATGLQVAGGLSTIPAIIAAAPAAAVPASLAGRIVAGTTVGSGTAALENASTAAGNAQPGKRGEAAARGLGTGAEIGAVIGAVAPPLAAAAGAGWRNVLDRLTVNKNLNQLGISRPAADITSRTLQADDALGPAGGARMVKAGSDAMLADAGPSAANLLDATIAKSGRGANVAAKAVDDRANSAGNRLKMVFDQALGVPAGVKKAAVDIAQKTARARDVAYNHAYSQPIDYASQAGRKVEEVFGRVPSDVLGKAIKEANEEMTFRGIKNQQIMANIGPDGTVSFREMPNMIQVDHLKRALGTVADKMTDNLGRPLREGQRAASLAEDLRDAAIEAVPAYRAALKLGGDKIAEDKALKLGYDLLNKGVKREDVTGATRRMTDPERTQSALGLRQRLDDEMANVNKALTDPNLDAREALDAFKDLSSRAAREKVEAAIGPQRAAAIYRELEKTQAALELKARVATNSKTAQRQAIHGEVDAATGNRVIDAVKAGEPFNAPKRVWQALTGGTPEAKAKAQEEVYTQIAHMLTGPRGPDAMRALQSLMDAYRSGTANQAAAGTLGKYSAGSVLLPAYQTGSQKLQELQQK
jgi:hypothetical protein